MNQDASVTPRTRPTSTTEPAPVLPLTDEDVARFHRDGFLRVDALTSTEEVQALQQVYDRLFEPGATTEPGDRVELAPERDGRPTLPQVLNPDRYAPELRDTTAYRNAFALARQLLGGEVHPMGMHAIRKPPRSGAETPWHQDEAYWDPAYDHPAISVWIPLQPATLDNGCMQFVAASHRGEVLDHQLIDRRADGLRLRDPSLVGEAVACQLPPGGATIHAARTLHRTGPNTTDEPRRALIMAFRAPPTPRADGRTFPWQPASWYE
jgi:hypothetical protein